MQRFTVLVALFAVAAANSYRPAEYAPRYETPKYQTTRYEEPKYETAKPYDFTWSVKDDATYNDFDHSESSDGKVTNGVYRVQLPDGRTQIVTYRADNYGYNADVKYTGAAKYPEYVQSNYKAATYSSASSYKPSTPTYSKPTYSAPVYTAPAYKAPVYAATPVYKTPMVQPKY